MTCLQIVWLLGLITAGSTVLGLKCYHCESMNDLQCQETMYHTPYDTDYVTECEGSCKRNYLRELNSFGLVRMCDPDAKDEPEECTIDENDSQDERLDQFTYIIPQSIRTYIEQGRCRNTPRHNSLYLRCTSNEIEDECRFLFTCNISRRQS
ncbi:hypothetical protein ScPMuIL_009291 [Solemya velum]